MNQDEQQSADAATLAQIEALSPEDAKTALKLISTWGVSGMMMVDGALKRLATAGPMVAQSEEPKP